MQVRANVVSFSQQMEELSTQLPSELVGVRIRGWDEGLGLGLGLGVRARVRAGVSQAPDWFGSGLQALPGEDWGEGWG